MEEQKTLTDWDSGLWDCFEDASTCCYGFWCCPFLAGTVTERFGENRCLVLCDVCPILMSVAVHLPVCVPPAGLSLRVAMRNRYGIQGSLCKDMTAACCCCWCAWCQMHRELKFRKQKPTVINVQTQNIVTRQPAPMMIQSPPQGGFGSNLEERWGNARSDVCSVSEKEDLTQNQSYYDQ